uniref:Uncharacterized protein n=1 Tax=Tanacetum cinerariifolium TaxID=118510 RepID=A0A699HYE6_TANCI|nr:hypothetical protein [Tanacetum cinerariifolium]
MRRVGKGFSGVETPLFEGMIVEQQVAKEGDADENVEDVNTGVATERFVSTADDDVGIHMDLFHTLLDTCTTLTRKVRNLEKDKIAQTLEIIKLKQRVKKLERRNKGRMIVEMNVDADVVLEEDKDVADDIVKDVQDADVEARAHDQGRQAKS